MALNPHKKNKVDISSLTEEEQKLFRLYGKLPTHKSLLNQSLKERKFFDSGDYALSKAGKSSPHSVGTAIPSPETIPHVKSPDTSVVGTPHSPSVVPTGSQPMASPVPIVSPVNTNVSSPPLGSSPTSGLSHEFKVDEVMSVEGDQKEDEAQTSQGGVDVTGNNTVAMTD